MNLLQDIQSSIIQADNDLGPTLLKLRLLAARLGSEPLEEWVKHEIEGYPDDVEVPLYRQVDVTFKGSFAGAGGSGLENVQIPSHLVKKHAGETWVHKSIQDSIGTLDDLTRSASEHGNLGIDASNLILILQGKIYKDLSCYDVCGSISGAAIKGLHYAVRSRILELTIALEKQIPAAAHIDFSTQQPAKDINSDTVTNITNQTIYKNNTIVNSGDHSPIQISITKNDNQSLIDYLVKTGLPKSDATDITEIIASEQSTSNEEPLGPKAKQWLLKNIQKAAAGTWSLGISVATKVISEAAKKYYENG